MLVYAIWSISSRYEYALHEYCSEREGSGGGGAGGFSGEFGDVFYFLVFCYNENQNHRYLNCQPAWTILVHR